ncbi:hypothetical protein D3C85_1375310 [compost metagenome]
MALMASPELKPGFGAPVIEIEVNKLNLEIDSGPKTLVIFINSVIGAIVPALFRTNILFSPSVLARNSGEA